MADDVKAALEEIRARNEDVRKRYGYVGGLLVLAKAEHDVPRLLALADALLGLHGSVPWYCGASDCEHPEPPEDSESHDDWHDDHPYGTGGVQICLLTQVDSFCPECTRLAYDTLEPEGDDFVSAPCPTRQEAVKALGIEVKEDNGGH